MQTNHLTLADVLGQLPPDAKQLRVLVGEEKCLKIRMLTKLNDGRPALLVEVCGAPRTAIKTLLVPIAPELVESVEGLFHALTLG